MAKKQSRKPAAAPETERFSGLVVKNTGAWYTVLPDGEPPLGATVNCKIKGAFRLRGIRTTNPVAVGDRVEVARAADGSAWITGIADRSNYIIRRASNLSKEASILAANLDQAALVATLLHPATSTTFIDRFLATAEAYRVPAVLVVNKIDLLESPEDRELLEAVVNLYTTIGYPVIPVSARTGEGMEALCAILAGKKTLLSGNSGVGKSTLINELIPGLDLRTAEISDIHDQGMHTTTFSEMFPLPEGGWLIDTPGVRGFGTIEMNPREVGHYFPEIFKAAEGCRYGDCSHTIEPGCAVLEALRDHRIAHSRYASYMSILADADPDKYRKPF